MPALGIQVVTEEDKRVCVSLPQDCTDVTLHWDCAFELGDQIGSTAFFLPEEISDPGQDEAEADRLRVGRYQDQFVVLYFSKTRKLNWGRNAGMLVGAKICDLATQVAEEIKRKYAR